MSPFLITTGLSGVPLTTTSFFITTFLSKIAYSILLPASKVQLAITIEFLTLLSSATSILLDKILFSTVPFILQPVANKEFLTLEEVV